MDKVSHHFDLVNLNVLDKYKDLPVDQIKADLDSRRSGFVMAFENIVGDFNLATAIRNTNAFCGEAVVIIGRRKYDRRGTVGTYHYEHLVHSLDLSIIHDYRARGYRIVAAENDPAFNPVSMADYNWPEKVFVLFGEEGRGLSPECLELIDEAVYIPQRGSVRSLNVGTASGIFLYDYTLKRNYF